MIVVKATCDPEARVCIADSDDVPWLISGHSRISKMNSRRRRWLGASAAALAALFVTTMSIPVDEGGLSEAWHVFIQERTQIHEQAQKTFVLSEELSRKVAEIHGVPSAWVAVALTENDPLHQQPAASSAVVLVYYKASTPLDDLAPQIKQLVADSVAGLSYEEVTIIFRPLPR
jgi:hypothetical protein